MEVHARLRMLTIECVCCTRQHTRRFDTLADMAQALGQDPAPPGWRAHATGVYSNFGLAPESEWTESVAEVFVCPECMESTPAADLLYRVAHVEQLTRWRIETVPGMKQPYPAPKHTRA